MLSLLCKELKSLTFIINRHHYCVRMYLDGFNKGNFIPIDDQKRKKMKTQFKFKIKDPLGLHLRPAKDMAQVFLETACEVQLTFQDQQVNAKSPLSLLTLAAPCESVMTLEITGDHNKQVLASFCQKFVDWMEPIE